MRGMIERIGAKIGSVTVRRKSKIGFRGSIKNEQIERPKMANTRTVMVASAICSSNLAWLP